VPLVLIAGDSDVEDGVSSGSGSGGDDASPDVSAFDTDRLNSQDDLMNSSNPSPRVHDEDDR